MKLELDYIKVMQQVIDAEYDKHLKVLLKLNRIRIDKARYSRDGIPIPSKLGSMDAEVTEFDSLIEEGLKIIYNGLAAELCYRVILDYLENLTTGCSLLNRRALAILTNSINLAEVIKQHKLFITALKKTNSVAALSPKDLARGYVSVWNESEYVDSKMIPYKYLHKVKSESHVVRFDGDFISLFNQPKPLDEVELNRYKGKGKIMKTPLCIVKRTNGRVCEVIDQFTRRLADAITERSEKDDEDAALDVADSLYRGVIRSKIYNITREYIKDESRPMLISYRVGNIDAVCKAMGEMEKLVNVKTLFEQIKQDLVKFDYSKAIVYIDDGKDGVDVAGAIKKYDKVIKARLERVETEGLLESYVSRMSNAIVSIIR